MTVLAIAFGLLAFMINAMYVQRNWRTRRWKIRLLQMLVSGYLTVLYLLILTEIFAIPLGGTPWLRAGIIVLLALSAAEGILDL